MALSQSGDDKLRERLSGRRVAFQGHIMRVETWDALLPSGKTVSREILRHNGAAAVAAMDKAGRILLVRQYRCPLDELMWEVPAGKLDRPEEPTLDAAMRELEEETGYTAAKWTRLTDLIPTPGYSDEHIGLYLAQELTQTKPHPDEDEFLIWAWVSLDEAEQAVWDGRIRDGKTICAILMAKRALARQNGEERQK